MMQELRRQATSRQNINDVLQFLGLLGLFTIAVRRVK